jgi:hypothetical protein
MRDCVRFNPGMRAAVCVAVWMGASTSLAQSHPETPASEVDDFLLEYAGSCAGPEGVTDCAAGAFETTFARRLVWIGGLGECQTIPSGPLP